MNSKDIFIVTGLLAPMPYRQAVASLETFSLTKGFLGIAFVLPCESDISMGNPMLTGLVYACGVGLLIPH
jgi:hypothetical protein